MQLLRSLCALNIVVGFCSLPSRANETLTPDTVTRAVNDYLNQMSTYQARMVVTKVVRLSSGRISEKTYNVECLSQDHIMRIARYARGAVEGSQTWFDIRQTVVFPTGQTAEWRHPGFPGQLTVGIEGPDATRVRHSAIDIGDPFAVLRKIKRVMDRQKLALHAITSETVVLRCTPGSERDVKRRTLQNDYIEIVCAQKLGLLPISMTRVCVNDDQNREFDSGATVSMKFSRTADGSIIPISAQRDTRIRPDVQGTLTITWQMAAFDRTPPEQADMSLKIPGPALVLEADTGRQYSAHDDSSQRLQELLGDFVEVLDQPDAKRAVALSFVGRSPDLPQEYALLRRQQESLIASSVSPWFVAANGFGLLVVGAFLFRRQVLRSISHHRIQPCE